MIIHSKTIRLLASIACLALFHIAEAETAEGRWSGNIALPGQSLAIHVELSQNEDKTWSGAISIPAQSLKDFPLSELTLSDASVSFKMSGIPGLPSFLGTLSPDCTEIDGQFTQGPQSFLFSLQRSGETNHTAVTKTTVPDKGIPGEDVAGEWLGTLRVGGMSLRLALHVQRDESSELHASMDSLDQGANDIAIDAISLDGQELEFSINRIDGKFTGTLSPDGSSIAGEWAQMGARNPLTFYRVEEAARLNRPQEPKEPFPYASSEVEYTNSASGLTLGGTLVIPEGDGPFPAVVLVSGSGPQDRDETLMGHKPFLVIADFLARRGIASLRYDDRGVGKSQGDHFSSTVEEFASDALAGVEFLASIQNMDTDRIGIIGHSEGGLIAPMVSVQSDSLDFLVLLAPPVVPLDQLLERQNRDLQKTLGADPELIERSTEFFRTDIALIQDPAIDRPTLKRKLRVNWQRSKTAFSESQLQLLGLSDARVQQNIEVASSAWFRSLIRIDPMSHFQQLALPTLALFGETDLQVEPHSNLAAFRDAMRSAENSRAHAEIKAGLNHLFQPSETGTPSEYGTIDLTFDPSTLQQIASWITERSNS